MKSSGWGIRPLGWLVLAILIGAVIYYMWSWLRPLPQKNEDKI
jgi:hypothetical protein